MQHLLQDNFITSKLGVTLNCETFKMWPLREISRGERGRLSRELVVTKFITGNVNKI